MATYELERQDIMRSNLKHLPVESLENLGEVNDSAIPPPLEPLAGQEPYSLAPYAHLFERADAMANAVLDATPNDGSEIHPDLIVEESEQ
jgi:hypothetical protein